MTSMGKHLLFVWFICVLFELPCYPQLVLEMHIIEVSFFPSFDHCLLRVLPVSKTNINSFCERTFMYAAPTLWNTLDLNIRLLFFYSFKKNQDPSLSDVPCKLILIIY